MTKHSIRLSFAVAPLGAVALYLMLVLADPFEGPGAVGATFGVLGGVAIIAYAAELFFGWPAFVVGRRFGIAGGSSFVVIGGLTIGFFVALILDLPMVNLARWKYYLAAMAAGLCSGFVFWWSLRWRPNKALRPTAAGTIQSGRG